MRSPADADIQIIDITNRCWLSCSNCTRDIVHQSSTKNMTPDTFRLALASLKGWWKPGRVIGIIGGEPLLNPNMSEIMRIFREEFNPGPALSNGRHPIKNFNAFMQERLFDRSNGKGLWTSFGPKWKDYWECALETFSHFNSNDHSQGGLHQSSLITAEEMCDALGIPWSEWPKYRDACWLQNTWSGTIRPSGKAYFCERAGSIDDLLFDGAHGWDIAIEPDWWSRQPHEFGKQFDLCNFCSMALPGPSQVDNLDRDIISPTWKMLLEKRGSPAVKGGRYELFDSSKHIERRTIDRKDNYVAPSGVRVAADNEFIYGKKVTWLTVCVGRGEFLAKTLFQNAMQVNEIVVVTTGADYGTKEVVHKHNDNCSHRVKLVLSERCHENGDAFNKGKMLNDGLAAIEKPDWILLADADVFLNKKLPDFLKTHALNPGVLYGTARLGDGDLPPGFNEEPNGVFQLFNVRAQAMAGRWPKLLSENFCSAGSVDSHFMQQWPADKRVMIEEIPVVHIPHGPEGSGWSGNERKPNTWRQLGMISAGGLIQTEKPKKLPADELRLLKLTDTLTNDNSMIVYADDLNDVVKIKDGEIIFFGENIGTHHVHVAYWNGTEAGYAEAQRSAQGATPDPAMSGVP
jgi:hypothetical protein